MRRLLMLLIVINDVNAYVELIGAGATAPVSVYVPWMAAYRSSRDQFVDVRLSYNARGSGSVSYTHLTLPTKRIV